ncbi:hypothetical protein B484DRAFT_249560 [Ochromonadaceae sp. CCMP2298]|nr:hypothetical protein B484DRAFT_249560 [Ochromonadaceae sp. CCMP2298]
MVGLLAVLLTVAAMRTGALAPNNRLPCRSSFLYASVPEEAPSSSGTSFGVEQAYGIRIRSRITRAAGAASIIAATLAQASVAKADEATVPVDRLESTSTTEERQEQLNSDEFIISFSQPSLGLKLTENFYKAYPVVTVKAIADAALREAHPELELGAIVVEIAGVKVDGTPLKSMIEIVKSYPRPLAIKFRDPNRFFKQLDSSEGPPRRIMSTSYLPANTRDVGAPEQLIIVERLEMPPAEQRVRSAKMLDVMEIQYAARLQSDASGRIVDSSAERAPPGTSAKSIYYVLGQQNGPVGKVPPGWDLTLIGMVPGEKRRITLPSTLAYDRKGDKEKGIPPFAALVYIVKLLSLT